MRLPILLLQPRTTIDRRKVCRKSEAKPYHQRPTCCTVMSNTTRQSRRLPIRAESASRVRVRVASDFRRFSLVWRPVGRGRSPSQKVLRPFGLPLLNRNAFRRGHSLSVVLHRKEKLIRISKLYVYCN